jgi:hypothetical protein
MDASERSRKRRELAPAPSKEPESVPPPARRRRVRNELDPEMLWDKETDENSEEYEADDDGFDEDGEQEGTENDNASEDLDDWDHPIRRLKIN